MPEKRYMLMIHMLLRSYMIYIIGMLTFQLTVARVSRSLKDDVTHFVEKILPVPEEC